MKLNATTRAALHDAGFTAAQWARMWGYAGSKWGGDQCGCFDDRCANGFHHSGIDDCGCFPAMLDDAVAWRQAIAGVNEVRLAAPVSVFRYVTVSTPGAAVIVSATAGGIPAGKPAQSVIRIEPRDAQTLEVTQDDDGTITVRIVHGGAR